MTHDENNNEAAAELLKAAESLRAIDLSLIPGHYAGAASHALPSASSTREPQSAVVDVPGVGRVRIHFERQAQKRRNFPAFWVMVRAERVGPL